MAVQEPRPCLPVSFLKVDGVSVQSAALVSSVTLFGFFDVLGFLPVHLFVFG